jgi:XLF-Cernunnos, XRcc4-like factor, NHEJ component
MSPTPPRGWNQLKTTSPGKAKKQSCPKLFYNYSAAPEDGITLLVTDLISLWRSHFSPRAVLDRAAAVHSSIDPSESNEQMQILLEKLALSLDQGDSRLARHVVEGSPRLVIRTSIDLPRPLRPLEWSFDLDACDAAELAEQILRPTLHQLSVSQQKLENLLKVMKEKDHVIEQLLDRVAGKGVDMSLIFPMLTGKAKRAGSGVKVDDARRLVPGMKVFDLGSWEKSLRDTGLDGAGDASEMGLEKLVEGFEKCFAHSEDEHTERLQKWFEKLPDVESLESAVSKGNMNRSQSQSQSQPEAEEDTESENEFETQTLPPAARRKRASPATEEKTSSSDDNDLPAAKRAKTGIAKLGGLGKKKTKTKPATRQEQSSSPQPAPKPTPAPRKKSDCSTDTATDSDFESDTRQPNQLSARGKTKRLGGLKKSSRQPSPVPPPTTAETEERSSSPVTRPPTASSTTSTPSHKLGRIGKARQRTTTASPVPEAEDYAQNTQQSEAVTPSRKLGRLGMRKKAKEEIQVENATSAPSTRMRDRTDGKGKEVGHEPRNGRSGADGAGNGDDSDATASPSPSPSPSPPPSVRPAARHPRPSAQSPNKIKDKGSVRSTTASRGKHSNSNSNSPKLQPQTAYNPEPKPDPDPEPETEEQKAAKRREELKRTIQAGGPKKKKRF